jgi:glycosyltransferase involved in cell wall biosynthesis
MISPLLGRRVALVHPAWHSCGTYRVVLGQIAAYRALGADVSPIAVSIDPGFAPYHRWRWRSFVENTPELNSGERFFGGAPFRAFLAPRFLRDAVWPYIHGDQAIIRTAVAERAQLSPELEGRSFDLVHCNHFFLMPAARRLAARRNGAARAPILLDSHDLQARQFALMNERMPWLYPRASYDSMLSQEFEQMRGADLLLHLNADEHREFISLLPEKTHALLYPPVPEAPTGPGGEDIVLVASNNSANVESVIWFLRDVVSLADDVPVKIAGTIEAGVRAREPQLYARFRNLFLGRVDDPAEVYANARLALLPTISGHGLSIKSVEALASGLPLIATSHAFRGMGEEALRLAGVTIADSAGDFAKELRIAAKRAPMTAQMRATSQTRRFYEANFSLSAYEGNLAAFVAPLLKDALTRREKI